MGTSYEIQTTTFLACQHQLAFTILAQWFITQTRLDWEERIDCNPQLLTQYEVSLLPALSAANVRELLSAALPLPTLSPVDAASLVVEHLDNRTCSRKSRLLNRSALNSVRSFSPHFRDIGSQRFYVTLSN